MSIFPGQAGEWALLMLVLPSRSAQPVGILLIDTSNRLHARLRSDWSSTAPDDEYTVVWYGLEEDLAARGHELGGTALLDSLDESASHTLQLGERHSIEVPNVKTTLQALYDKHIVEAERAADAKNKESHKRYLVHFAIAAALVMTVGIGMRWAGLIAPHRSISTVSSYLFRGPVLLPQLPMRPSVLLDVEGRLKSAPASHRRVRTRTVMAHRHKAFQFESMTFEPLTGETVHIDEPPAYDIAELNATSVLEVSLPEPPSFQARRNRFVQFLCVLASPFKKLFSSRNTDESVLN